MMTDAYNMRDTHTPHTHTRTLTYIQVHIYMHLHVNIPTFTPTLSCTLIGTSVNLVNVV